MVEWKLWVSQSSRVSQASRTVQYSTSSNPDPYWCTIESDSVLFWRSILWCLIYGRLSPHLFDQYFSSQLIWWSHLKAWERTSSWYFVVTTVTWRIGEWNLNIVFKNNNNDSEYFYVSEATYTTLRGPLHFKFVNGRRCSSYQANDAIQWLSCLEEEQISHVLANHHY